MARKSQATEENPNLNQIDPIVVGLPIPGLTPGRVVHWVKSEGEHRPAIVVAVLETAGLVNLIVFMDGERDGYAADNCGQWLEARQFDPVGAVNTWHFIERA